MTLIFSLLFFAYVILVVLLTIGWIKSIAAEPLPPLRADVMVSVIIPVRNEQANIGNLLEDLRKQSHRKFEVIIVNDHSGDLTTAIVVEFTKRDTRFILLPTQGEGKKKALTTGINASTGEIIITTDGDCRVGSDWLTTISNYFTVPNTKMVFGGVRLQGLSFFSIVQSHEFLSLIGTAAATLWYGFPSMCNGANLAFRKATFIEVGGYTNNLHIPSGDDEFLMRKIFALYPDGIQFVKDGRAVVGTSASINLKAFVHQRVRWAGKWKHNVSSSNAILAFFIFCFQLGVLLLPIIIAVGWIDVGFGVLLLLLKVIVEGIFLKKIAAFVNVPWKWPAFIFLQIFYSIYAVWIGLISSFSSFEWKGRKSKSVAFSVPRK
ncbi:MAG TPA: glycosyltransferase [Chryseolinea sp.]|nr:glycosyltransferase [Chryseolinea sp.]